MDIFQPITDDQARINQGGVSLDIHFPAIDARVNAVVVTPACDLEQNKAHFVKFIATAALDLVMKIIAANARIDESVFESGAQISERRATTS